MSTGEPNEPARDARLYLRQPEGWTAHVKTDASREYCYWKSAEEDGFHLLVTGEIYLERDREKICLNCAMKHDLITHNRQHWQRRGNSF